MKKFKTKPGLAENVEVGKTGERIAREYLENKGYKIVEQNYRTKYAEIDLLAKKDNALALIEVRTRTGEQFGAPEETINKRKMRKLRMNALAYTSRIQWKGSCQIDIVCVVLDKNHNLGRINHYENIC